MATMNQNKTGYRIRVARAMQKPPMRQDNLVAKLQFAGLNISKNTLSRIELGDPYVTDLGLIALSKVLNVTTSWLLAETNDPQQG